MKPNKPGCWFYEHIDGRAFPIIVVSRLDVATNTYKLKAQFRMKYKLLNFFEGQAGFKRWLGPAVPMKELKPLRAYVHKITHSETYGDERHLAAKLVVSYADVAEFDLMNYKEKK